MAESLGDFTPPVVGPPPGNGGVSGVFTGGSAVGQFLGLIGTLFGDLNEAITAAGQVNLQAVFGDLVQQAGKWADLSGLITHGTFQKLSDLSVGTFFTEMLEYGLDVRVSNFAPDARRGVETTDTMLGFAILLPFIIGAMEAPMKLLLGNRLGTALFESIEKLPEEMGISWVLGTSIEKAFDAAVGMSIEEGILEQKRSTRLDWPILRQAWRQGLLDTPTLTEWLRKLGYPDDQIEFIAGLDLHQLPVGDLQALWAQGIISGDTLKQELRDQGWTEQEAGWLKQLYVDKAETAAGTLYRNTARSLFLQRLITEDQYRAILEGTHYPPTEVADDIAAVTLEQSTGRLQATLTSIKTAYLKGHQTPQWVLRQLDQLGYTPAAQQQLIHSWDLMSEPKPMSLARVLSYYASGVLTLAETRTRLGALDLSAQDLNFYLAHPRAASGVHVHPLTPSLVGQAYLAGAIEDTNLIAHLEEAGASPEAAHYMADNLRFRHARQKRPAGASQPLSASQITDAWAYGLLDVHTAQSELEHLGYSPDDAWLILEIKNKGTINLAPAPPPLFSNLQQALDYLRSQGYTLQPPENPQRQAAEQLAEQYGWIPIPPPAGVGSGPTTGLGGQAP